MIFSSILKFFKGKPKEPQFPVIFVADIPLNRENSFWTPYIGTAVEVHSMDPDGLVNVKVHDQDNLIRGIDHKRFT